jgi:hypothetical protein
VGPVTRHWPRYLGVVLVTLVLLELGTCVLVESGELATIRPQYWQGFWVSGHPDFGVWRPSNATHQHRTRCFDVNLHTNSVGARDAERPLRSRDRRVVVLGDSFMGGWGVEEGERVSNLLESWLGLAHLNFAMDAFGPYQSLLVYRELASRYDHEVVLLGLLPENDLVDIDFEQSRHLTGHIPRYRPYLIGAPPDFERFDHRESALSHGLRQVSYLYKTLLRLPPSRVPEGRPFDAAHAEAPSWFYDFTPDQVLRLEEILRRLADASGDKTLVVALLPVEKDLERFKLSGPAPLARRLARVAHKKGFALVSLLAPMAKAGPETWGGYFHDCDYHWNAEGHRVAAEILKERLWNRAD